MAHTETNTTLTQESLKVINSFDTDILNVVQAKLAPVYETYPVLTTMVFGIPLANLIAATLLFLLILGLRKVFTRIVLAFLQKLAKRTETFYDDRIISALKQPVRFMFIVIALHVFFR